jgi:hypothetical protein
MAGTYPIPNDWLEKLFDLAVGARVQEKRAGSGLSVVLSVLPECIATTFSFGRGDVR